MTPNLWPLLALVAGLALGVAVAYAPFETIKLTESSDNVRFYPVAITNRLTGAVRFCYVEPDLARGFSRYACH